MGKKQKKKTKDQSKKRRIRFDSGTPYATQNTSEVSTVDFISSLPDDVLRRIISLLPYESALQTSFLSTRWRVLWNTPLVKHGTTADTVDAVTELLDLYDMRDPLRVPRKLQFHFSNGYILLATISAKGKLHLDFSTGNQEFSRQFGWLLLLKFANPIIPSWRSSPYAFLVKSIHLKSLSYLTYDTVSTLFTNFPSMKSLKITECNGLRALFIDTGVRLESLTILDCPQLKSLHIEPNLICRFESFRYRGKLPWFCFNQQPLSLADAMLDSREGPGYHGSNCNDFGLVLSSIRNVNTLTLCKWAFEELVGPLQSPEHANFQFHKLKELWWIDNSKEKYNPDALTSFLKFCPSLERLFVTIDPRSYMSTCSEQLVFSIPQKGKETKQPKKKQGYTQLKHLKMVKLEGFLSQEDVISLAEQLRKIVSVEPIIISTSHGNCLQSLIKVPSQQPQRNKFTYKFVEEVYYVDELCPKHAHMRL